MIPPSIIPLAGAANAILNTHNTSTGFVIYISILDLMMLVFIVIMIVWCVKEWRRQNAPFTWIEGPLATLQIKPSRLSRWDFKTFEELRDEKANAHLQSQR